MGADKRAKGSAKSKQGTYKPQTYKAAKTMIARAKGK